MMKRLFFCVSILTAIVLTSCNDNDSFTTSRSDILTFSKDTVLLDTVFSTVPTPTYTFWVYNNSSDGLRLRQVRLKRGNQSGFRVNVDGTYLENTTGSQVRDLEIRKGDSIRVFVELTSALTNSDDPQLVEDNLVFSLESGVEQEVNLRAYSWDALLYNNIVVSKDTVISSLKPIVIKGGLKVDSGVTLTITPPAKLYFHNGAGINVYGRLIIDGVNSMNKIVLRGDRTDKMFAYLPYDRVSGQWKGIHIYPSSSGNRISHTDIHSSEYGVVCDSAEYDSITPRLAMESVTVHNCKGPGVIAYNSNISLVNCQITNTLNDCVAIYGGRATLVYCTLAQFYPFDGNRGVALRFSNNYNGYDYPLTLLECYNTLVTGYADDEIMGEVSDSTVSFNYYFSNCILRTPAIEDSIKIKPFVQVFFESPKDTIQGKVHFRNIDSDNMYYDFHLDSLSTARRKAIVIESCDEDHDGTPRGMTPDIGCYQYATEESPTSGHL